MRFKEFQLEKIRFLAQVVEKWDELPVGFLQHLDLRKSVYGYIGLHNYTLGPTLEQVEHTHCRSLADQYYTDLSSKSAPFC